MTRQDASTLLTTLINAGILDVAVEDALQELINCICYDEFEPCHDCGPYCEGCPNLE